MKGFEPFLAFAHTARGGSFAAAARALSGTPSAIAKSVARLEDTLGVKLFHRTTRQVSLTPDGERLFDRCQRVLAEFEELQAEAAGARGTPSGLLRVELPIVYGREFVMPVLADLMHRYPALQLEVRLLDSYSDLVRDSVDVSVRVGALRDSSLVARRIDWQTLLLVASPAYLKRNGTPRTLGDLQQHTGVVFRQPTSGRNRPWRLTQGKRPVELHPTHHIHVNDGEGVIQGARLGMGLCQVPDCMVQGHLVRGELVEVLPAHRPPPEPIHAVIPSGRLLPPRVRVLLEALDGLRTRSASA